MVQEGRGGLAGRQWQCQRQRSGRLRGPGQQKETRPTHGQGSREDRSWTCSASKRRWAGRPRKAGGWCGRGYESAGLPTKQTSEGGRLVTLRATRERWWQTCFFLIVFMALRCHHVSHQHTGPTQAAETSTVLWHCWRGSNAISTPVRQLHHTLRCVDMRLTQSF